MNSEQVKLLSVREVSLTYRSSHSLFRREKISVLKNISFDVFKGETLGILGKNGAGKSTLLRLLARVYQPDSGSIIDGGITSTILSVSAGFDQELSGKDNILFAAMILGCPKQKAEDLMTQIINFSELHERIHMPVKTYSTGMQARLAFSIAIHIKPDIVLIDEMLSVGDMSFRQKAEESISSMLSSKQTVVLVSHVGNQVKQLCDRAIWLEDSVIKMIGKAEDVVNAYENTA